MANQSTIPVLAASGANVWIGMVAGAVIALSFTGFTLRFARQLRASGRARRPRDLKLRQPARELRESKRN